MKTHLTHTFLNAVMRWSEAPRLGGRTPAGGSSPPPDHVMLRLENVFEALSELPSQPHVAGALELACEALEAELPSEALAAGLYDIDADEIRILAARGLHCDRLRGTAITRARCLGPCGEKALITSGAPGDTDWLGSAEQGSTVLLCPIVHDTHLLGAVALANPLCAAQFGDHDLDLVRYVARQLADFIQAHRLRPAISAPNASPVSEG